MRLTTSARSPVVRLVWQRGPSIIGMCAPDCLIPPCTTGRAATLRSSMLMPRWRCPWTSWARGGDPDFLHWSSARLGYTVSRGSRTDMVIAALAPKHSDRYTGPEDE